MTHNGWTLMEGYEYLGTNPEVSDGAITVINTRMRPAVIVGLLEEVGPVYLFMTWNYLTRNQVRECLRYMKREDLAVV